MKLSGKIVLPILVFASSLAVVAAMISARPIPESNRPIEADPLVEVMRVEPRSVQLQVRAQGTVAPRTESDLVTEISGRIMWVSPELASGGFLSEGDVLARIDRRDYEISLEGASAALARAQSELRHAAAELERQRSMRTGGASSRAQLDDAIHRQTSADAGVREARVAVKRAELDLERTEIRAPFVGRVREKHVDLGQFVSRGARIARMYAVDYAEVRLPISNADLAYLDLPGAETTLADADGIRPPDVLLSADYAGQLRTWPARLVRTEGALDARTRMLSVVARIDDPYARVPDEAGRVGAKQGGSAGLGRGAPLHVGLFVNASIAGRRVDGVFEIPRAALRRNHFVWVIDDNDRLRVRKVDVLRSFQGTSWIESGLSTGDRVVTSPIEIVTEGMRVRTTEQGAATAADHSSFGFDAPGAGEAKI